MLQTINRRSCTITNTEVTEGPPGWLRKVEECDFSNHICGYNRGLQTQDKRYEYNGMKWKNITQIERFTDEVCARVEPGSSEIVSILSL